MADDPRPEEGKRPNQEPGTEIVPRRFVACPFLGLKNDRTVTAIVPTVAHVCYAGRRQYSPSVEHQHVYCFSPIYPQCSRHPAEASDDVDPLYALVDSEDRLRPTSWLPWVGTAVAILLVIAILYLLSAGIIQIQLPATSSPELGSSSAAASEQQANAGVADETALAVSTDNQNPTQTPAPDSADNQNDRVAQAAQPTELPLALPGSVTPEPVVEQLRFTPRQSDVGWWVSADDRQIYIGDSFLYAGAVGEEAFITAIRYDLRRMDRGAPILGGTLRLTGARDILAEQVQTTGNEDSAGVTWLVQLIAESDLSELPGNDFLAIASAPASITLSPPLASSEVAPGQVNEWSLDEGARNWLYQQVIDGATSVTVRLIPYGVDGEALFAWDSGHGSESQGEAPVLILDMGAPPPTPPPTPTRPVLVATFTPEPENVLTLVARSAPATARALEGATATETQVFIVTPTPLPENFATLQAAAMAEGLPAVVLHTPVPANAATLAAISRYATAVALTTGTFTPVPTGYVTPVIYYQPPPPENVATAAARALRATAQAQSGTPPATLPWNAVTAVYEWATPTPGNSETAIAVIQERNNYASTTGTPTPTPFNLVVITRVPEPTATPIPLIVSARDITPTPTPTPTRELTPNDIAEFRNKILFLSDRTGVEAVWAMDPDSGEVIALVTDERLHQQARELLLPISPDGRQRVFVVPEEGSEGATYYHLRVEDLEYGVDRQITDFDGAASYDPAWSPVDDRIAFVSTESNGDEIYVVRAGGGDPTRLTFNQWEWDKHPTWSPDGNRIAFYSNRDSGLRQIWVMNADGSNQINLSSNEFNDWDPVWVR